MIITKNIEVESPKANDDVTPDGDGSDANRSRRQKFFGLFWYTPFEITCSTGRSWRRSHPQTEGMWRMKGAAWTWLAQDSNFCKLRVVPSKCEVKSKFISKSSRIRWQSVDFIPYKMFRLHIRSHYYFSDVIYTITLRARRQLFKYITMIS